MQETLVWFLSWEFPWRRDSLSTLVFMGFLGGTVGKESTCTAGDLGSIPGLGRSPGEGHGNPLQYSCLENPMEGGAWRATVHGFAKSWTWLRDYQFSTAQRRPWLPIRCKKAMREKDRKEDNGLCPTNQINGTFPTEQWWKAGLLSFLYFLLMIQNSCILRCVHALSSSMLTSAHSQESVLHGNSPFQNIRSYYHAA